MRRLTLFTVVIVPRFIVKPPRVYSSFHRTRRAAPRLPAWLLIACVLFDALSASACSVPVFRYALERWNPDAYGVVLFHKGALTAEQDKWLEQMDPDKMPADQFVNLMIKRVDLEVGPEPEAVNMWKEQATRTLPWMILYYPRASRIQGLVWSGPFNGGNVKRLVDSPARREIARRLLKGQSAVWALVESGDEQKDAAAAGLLERRLRHLEANLQLPEINPRDVIDGLISIDEADLKIGFSTVRLSRADRAEEIFIRMLLGSESDLKDYAKEPIVFPIFGRGRALFALAGKGIAKDTIDEACLFLTGSCSCEVKEQNPGIDLVMSVHWDRLVQQRLDIDRELPPLAGFVGLATGREVTGEKPVPEPSAYKGESAVPQPEANEDDSRAASAKTDGVSAVIVSSLVACALVGFTVITAGFFLGRKK